MRIKSLATLVLVLLATQVGAQPTDSSIFQPRDIFDLEWASDPQISPDGSRIVYVRNFMDIMSDKRRSNLWIIDFDGSNHRPITTGVSNDRSPRWSPDGERLLYVSTANESSQLFVRWMDTGQVAQITHLTEGPGSLVWSPDGRRIALAMRVPAKSEPFAGMPEKPEGATWADPPKVIEKLRYRADGAGFLKDGFQHIFVVPADGGSPRQVTSGDYDHDSRLSWSRNGQSLFFSANRRPDGEYQPLNSEIYSVSLQTGAIEQLTDRNGPDRRPMVSPDGKKIAYLGFDDRMQGYQLTRLYVMDLDGGHAREISTGLDRSIQSPSWDGESQGLFIYFNSEGNGKLAHVTLDGKVRELASNLGGLSLGRPYSGSQYTAHRGGRYVFTHSTPDHPADLATGTSDAGGATRITWLNEDLLGHKQLAEVEELWWESSYDGRQIQGWIATPPGFDSTGKYPLILEIHGGPFANYGDRFSTEVQLYAAAGYVVLYTNPRGSTSYGEEFGNLIHHNYPGQDFDDLMSGVDAVLAREYVDPDQLFVTGGSGGGVLTAWIVGHTDRFRAAVSAKPVINWYSFVLTADSYNFFYKYWFPGFPWDHPEQYLERSPLHHVGNVSTPTMLLTGEVDYRTPMSESEQFYQALKLRQIDTALVRIPGASHGIANRPSQLIAKVNHILKWFLRYRPTVEESP